MKKLILLCLPAALLLGRSAQAQSVGIGTLTPNSKAALDLTSTTQGLLVPRLTAAQRTAITAPPQGLMVYQTDGTAGGGAQTGFWYYAGTGGWVLVNPTGAADNLGNHTATQNLNLTDKLLVGGTAGSPGTSGLSVSGTGQVGIGTAAPNSRLSLSPSAVEPKITLWDGGSTTNHYGFGVSGGQLNYHVGSTSDAHVFSAGGKNGDGTELARFTGAGRLGLGTATPAATLEVRRGLAPDGTAAFYGTDRISHFSYATTEDTYIRGGKAAANVLLNDNGGSVGIGTAAPFSLLANTAINVVGADGYGVGTKSLTWSSNLVGYAGAIYNANPGAGQNGLALKVAGANAAATALDVSQGLAGTAGASLLMVRANGYVGLGTSAPTATLDVRRGTALNGTAAFYGTTRISHFSYATAEDTYIRGGKATSNVYLNDDGGNVGIGAGTVPPEKLTVAGTVYSSSGGFRFPDGTLQTTAAAGLALPYAGTGNSAGSTFSVTNTNTGGVATGVRGEVAGNGYGTRGLAGIDGYGVDGYALGSNGRGVNGEATDGTGVYGSTANGYGVQGVATGSAGWGIEGTATDGVGVRAISGTGSALWATSTSGPAVQATSGSTALVVSSSSFLNAAATITTTGLGLALDVGGTTRTKAVTTPNTGAHNMLPIAYGHVADDGTVSRSTGNFTVTYNNATTSYIVTFPQYATTDLATSFPVVTASQSDTNLIPGIYVAIVSQRNVGSVEVVLFYHQNGPKVRAQQAFDLVLYKP